MRESNVKEVAEALHGYEIVGYEFARDEDDPGLEEWGRLVLVNKEGFEVYIEPSCDPEGNAPGFLFFGERDL